MEVVVCRRACLFVACLLAASCTADLRDVTFVVPTKVHRFDSSTSVWADAPARLPDRGCADAGECCASLGEVVTECRRVELGCAASCSLTLVLEQITTAQILRDVPDLTLLDPGARSRLRVSGGTAAWQDPPETSALTELALAFAPVSATGVAISDARRIGRFAPMKRGAPVDLQVDEEAAAALARVLRNAEESFAIVAQLRVRIRPGDAVPRGRFAIRTDLDLTTRLGP